MRADRFRLRTISLLSPLTNQASPVSAVSPGRAPCRRTPSTLSLKRSPKRSRGRFVHRSDIRGGRQRALAFNTPSGKRSCSGATYITPAAQGAGNWLLPLPVIEKAAAATGHVSVSTGSDGIARQILIQMADDQGRAIRAMAVEAIRVADGISDKAITETSREVLLGSRVIPVEETFRCEIGVRGGATQMLRAARMMIDYIGPPGSYQDLQLRRRCRRTHRAGAVARQIRADRSNSGFLRRSPRFALHSR